MALSSEQLTTIESGGGRLSLDMKGLWAFRELLYFLVKRDIKVRYKQTLLGGLWAVLQPVFTMVIFTIFFGRMAKIPSDGIPYPIFVYAGLLPWIYFANAVANSGNSLVGNANLITKIYFPRIIIPAASCLAGLLDFLVAVLVLAAMMVYYRVAPGPAVLILPVLVGLTVAAALGVGLWLSALNVQYRDVRYVIPFLIQLWLFVTPVIYPVSMVDKKYQWVLALNPMGGLIDAYRACMLGRTPVDWVLLSISACAIAILLATGLVYFYRMEETFADVV